MFSFEVISIAVTLHHNRVPTLSWQIRRSHWQYRKPIPQKSGVCVNPSYILDPLIWKPNFFYRDYDRNLPRLVDFHEQNFVLLLWCITHSLHSLW